MAAQEGPSHRSLDDSMRHLWRVLKNLFEKASEEKFGPVCNIYSAQAYGDIWRFQELLWQPGNDSKARFDSMHFEADPEDIPDMTKSVLSQLQTVPTAELHSLSPEPPTLSRISDLPMECAFQISPSAWCEALREGCLSWLWDLDPDAVAQKEVAKPPEQEWNWELHVRQLAQVNLHEPRAVLEALPMGLRNRRRIWRLVEDILSEEVADYYITQWQKK